MTLRALGAAGLLLLVLACGRPPATVAEQAQRIERRVWSPYCPGRLLGDCTTSQASDLRDQIVSRLTDGDSADEVTAWLVDNYGDEVLAAPPNSAAGAAIWVVPIAVAVAGAIGVGGLIVRWRRAPGASGQAGTVDDLPDDEREYWIARVREQVDGDA